MGKLEKDLYQAEKIKRMFNRKLDRNDKYRNKVRQAGGRPLRYLTHGFWPDSNSSTGYSQVCNYQPGYSGNCTCAYPCQGDC